MVARRPRGQERAERYAKGAYAADDARAQRDANKVNWHDRFCYRDKRRSATLANQVDRAAVRRERSRFAVQVAAKRTAIVVVPNGVANDKQRNRNTIEAAA